MTGRTPLVAQRLKPLPAMRDTWVQSLGWEDPLEKKMATHSGILAMENPMDYSPQGRKELDTTERLHFHFLGRDCSLPLFGSNLPSKFPTTSQAGEPCGDGIQQETQLLLAGGVCL